MSLQRKLEVWKLGAVNYSAALKLQEKLYLERRTCHNLLVPESELRSIGAELHYSERGGDITYHGPRQAILYPIISLRDIGFLARKYVEALEDAMIDLTSIYGVQARRGRKCETGVWVGERKIGAIGVRISSGVTSHGLAFNVDPDLSYFKKIVPCGIKDKEVTSLKAETNKELPDDEVIHEQLVQCFAKTLRYNNVTWRSDVSSLYADKRK